MGYTIIIKEKTIMIIMFLLFQDVCFDSNCTCDIVEHCHSNVHSIVFLSTDFDLGTSEATHDTDYYLTVTVRNHAQLQTSLTRQFTVDLTPPLGGAVVEKDWLKQTHDIDYQSNRSFSVHWEGFFDRETSIIAYQYIVDTRCAELSSFQYPNLGDSVAIDTYETSITFNTSIPGTYYTTVVAFNGAYLPSEAVCSDGITVDMEPPVFTGLNVPGARGQEGRVTVDGVVWVIHEDRQRSLVQTPGLNCVNGSSKMSSEELNAFPIKCTGYVSFVDIVLISMRTIIVFDIY